MSVEHGFTGDGEQRFLRGDDPMGLAPAEPEASLVVEITEVAHPVHQRRRRPLGRSNLGGPGGLRALEIGLCDHGALDDDLADRADRRSEVVSPHVDRFIRDADHLDPHPGDRLADADSRPEVGVVARLAENFVAADRGDGERLGRTVGSEDLHSRREHAGEPLQHPRRRRRAGRDDALQRRQSDLVFRPVVADPFQQRRGAKHVGRRKLLDRADDLRWIDGGGSGRVHLGDDRRHPERRREQGEEGERAEVHLAGLDLIEVAECDDLRGEDAVRVDRSFRRAGAAAGEENRGRLSGGGRRGGERLVGRAGHDEVAHLQLEKPARGGSSDQRPAIF